MKGETVFSFFLLAVVSAFIIISLGYRMRAAFGPLAVGIPAAVLLVIHIILNMVKDTAVTPTASRATDDVPSRRRHVEAISWIIGLMVATYFFGMLLTFPLWTFAYMRASRWKWTLCIYVGAAVFVFLYGFSFFLQVMLYKGILFG